MPMLGAPYLGLMLRVRGNLGVEQSHYRVVDNPLVKDERTMTTFLKVSILAISQSCSLQAETDTQMHKNANKAAAKLRDNI